MSGRFVTRRKLVQTFSPPFLSPKPFAAVNKILSWRYGNRVVNRCAPVEKPVFMSEEGAVKAGEQRRNEIAFLLTWLGLGGVILIQGILLAS